MSTWGSLSPDIRAILEKYLRPATGLGLQIGDPLSLDTARAAKEVAVDPVIASGKGVLEATEKGMKGEPFDPGKMTFDIFNSVPVGVGGAQAALSLAGRYFPKMAEEAAPNALGTFIGRKGASNYAKSKSPYANVPNEALDLARQMETKGVDPEGIWRGTAHATEGTPFTGVYRGVDGDYRVELDDSTAKVTRPDYGRQLAKGNTRGTWLNHPELYRAYPEMRKGRMKWGIGISKVMPEGNAEYNVADDITTFGAPEGWNAAPVGSQRGVGELKPVMMHEFTHAVQGQEGFAGGASPSTIVPRIQLGLLENASKRIDTDPSQVNTAIKIGDELKRTADADTRFNAYQREAGEAEARLVANRTRMDTDQRRNMSPMKAMDVPMEKQFALPPFTKGLFANSEKAAPLSLVPAMRGPDGKVFYGRPGQLHAEIYDERMAKRYPALSLSNQPRIDEGFALGKKFLTRDEARAWVDQNQPGVAKAIDDENKRIGSNYTKLDAQQYDNAQWARGDGTLFANPKKAAALSVPLSIAGGGRASPETIRNAAVESRGMTQQGLRDLYNELGLTGQAPSDFVLPSLNAQLPQKVIDDALALKLEDRRALSELAPEERAKFVRGKPAFLSDGSKFVMPSQRLNNAAAKANAPLTKAVKKAEEEYDRAPAPFGVPLFDLSPAKLRQLPNQDQFPLPRLEAKVTDRLRPAFDGGAGLKRLESAAGKAAPEMWGWYNLEQTRNDFHYLHGPELGEKMFNAWLDSLAGTSMLNPISNNIRSSTEYFSRLAKGEPLPRTVQTTDPISGKTVSTLAAPPATGYGAKSQVQHAQRVDQFLRNQGDPVKNAKPMSYRQNLGGNWTPRTVDTHDIRNMVGMPYAKSAFNEEKSALLPGEYTALEDLGGQAAARAGTPQAPQQAGTWIGGGEYTKLKSVPLPVQAELQRRIMVTAKVYGMHPVDVYKGFMRGEMRLLANGASAAPFGLAVGSQQPQ